MYFIYTLLKDGEVVYVGRSKNVKNRVRQHKYENKKDFDSYEVIQDIYDLRQAKEIEDYFICKYDPIYNKSLNGCGKYFSIKEETKGKKYDIAKLLDLVKIYDVRPIFSDKYQDSTIMIILRECEIKE